MSELSYLEKLLDGAEVQWMALGSVIKTVTAPSKLKSQAYRASGKLPIIDQGIKFIAGYTDEDVAPVEAGKYIIFGDHSEHIKYVDFRFVQGADGLKILSPISDNAKYIYHAFLNFYTKELSYKRHWSSAQQTLIPIPCPNDPEKSLAIQAEIVRVLDKFTALTAELTAELTARKKQYNYYRDQLLSFDEGEVEWKALGEVGHIVTGRTPKSSDKSAWGDDVDFVTPSDIKNGMRNITCPSRRLSAEGAASMPKVRIPRGSLLVTCIGADMGKTVINANDCIPNQQINAITLSDDSVQVGYLFHILTAMRETLRRQGELGGGTMPLINKSDFSKIVVPIPSHEEQNRIAKILDKFDTLTNSISEGLPREIELRQQQYEYYRDLLFSFPKPEIAQNTH
ncbi:restriction endonuclease subunit S [Hafnia alvei]|uniref:restriction endonuclease subunit S n=1 Tax=Hafnia alvei TaxID=569 RepID=UPI003FD6A8A3